MGAYILFASAAFFLILFGAQGFKIVQQAEAMVIERLGSYHRTLHNGISFIWPMLDKPREIEWKYVKTDLDGKTVVKKEKITRIDLREAVLEFPEQAVITRDNVTIKITAILYFQIVDPVRAVYEIANLPDAIEKLVQTTLRNVMGEMDLDRTLSSRDTVNDKLKVVLDEATEKWGVKVNRVELQDIHPPQDIRDAMEKQMRAERDRRAAILEAEGHKKANILGAEGSKEAEINMAEGQKRAKVLIAEGEAEARIRIAQAEAEAISKITEALPEGKGNAATYLIALRYIEALKQIASGKESKVVFLPYEATGILGSIGGIRELFDGVTSPHGK